MLLTKSTFISICVFGGIGKYLSNVVCSNGVSNSICAYFGLNLIFIVSWNYYKYKYIVWGKYTPILQQISEAFRAEDGQRIETVTRAPIVTSGDNIYVTWWTNKTANGDGEV